MILKKVAFLVGIAMMLHSSVSRGALLNSWENDEEGWTILQPAYASAGFDGSTGVTDQAYSWIISGGDDAPDYGVFFEGPSTIANTSILSTAASISIDVTIPTAGDFEFQQWSAVIDNADSGYVSLDGYSYSQSPVIGDASAHTLSWTIPASVRSALAASAAPSKVLFQIGGGSNGETNNTMYVDNLRTTEVPEPATLLMAALSSAAILSCRRLK